MKTIKNFIIRLFCLLIIFKKPRKKIRRWLMNLKFSDLYWYFYFNLKKIRPNSVLLIEFNNCHGEVISALCPYFEKLGYNIDILAHYKLFKEKAFCRLHNKNIQTFECGIASYQWFIDSKKIHQYKHIVLCSSAFYFFPSDNTWPTTLPKFEKAGLFPFVIEHELNDIKHYHEEKYLLTNHLITLGKFNQGTFVNPHYFGKIVPHNKNTLTTFICVGAIEKTRKNHELLFKSVQNLIKFDKNFKVIIIGKGKLENLPEDIRPYFVITGRLDFPNMFKYLDQADFFLPLLDPDKKDHERYITTGVTGSAQLIYGFSKVPVLHPKFAPFYQFDENNAILTTNLADGMKKAIQMSADEYQQKQSALTDLAQKLENESLHNLKEILK